MDARVGGVDTELGSTAVRVGGVDDGDDDEEQRVPLMMSSSQQRAQRSYGDAAIPCYALSIASVLCSCLLLASLAGLHRSQTAPGGGFVLTTPDIAAKDADDASSLNGRATLAGRTLPGTR